MLDSSFLLANKSLMTMASPSIRDIFKDQTVLLTGGTGFIGQALLYKLLKYGCRKIYVLIRPHRNQEPRKRLDKIISNYIFDDLRENDPDLRSRVTDISGEIGPSGLILLENEKKILQEEVTIFFHAAASVKFDDPLDAAVSTNLTLTRDTIQLAKTMKNLKMYHYVSTAYSNFDKKFVEEKVYEAKMDYEKLITACQLLPREILHCLERKITGSSQNTYIFTKHLCETVVAEAANEIPIVITRPPVVTNTWKEPSPGWMSNLSSPIGILGGCGKGVLRFYLGPRDCGKSYVPVDPYLNQVIVCTWKHFNQIESPPPLYHVDSIVLSAGDLYDFCMPFCETTPMRNTLWYPRFHVIENRQLYLIAHVLFHVFPALFLDALLKAAGQPVRLCRIYRKMYNAFHLLHPFLVYNENFKAENFKRLEEFMTEDEKKEFIFNLTAFQNNRDEINTYIGYAEKGFRRFIGDPIHTTKRDHIHRKVLFWMDRALLTSLTGLILWFLPYNALINIGKSILSFFIPLEFVGL